MQWKCPNLLVMMIDNNKLHHREKKKRRSIIKLILNQLTNKLFRLKISSENLNMKRKCSSKERLKCSKTKWRNWLKWKLFGVGSAQIFKRKISKMHLCWRESFLMKELILKNWILRLIILKCFRNNLHLLMFPNLIIVLKH